jgi:hypothetical protein
MRAQPAPELRGVLLEQALDPRLMSLSCTATLPLTVGDAGGSEASPSETVNQLLGRRDVQVQMFARLPEGPIEHITTGRIGHRGELVLR